MLLKTIDLITVIIYNVIVSNNNKKVNNYLKGFKTMKNQDIRNEITKAGLKLWQIAEKLGINDGNFSRMLRQELSTEKKEEIRGIIKKLKEGDN